MSKALLDLLLPNTPYFGGATEGIQGHALPRHPAMSATVHALSREGCRRLRVLEIGAYAGFSALTWAQSIEEYCPDGGEILCIDPWLGYSDEAAVEQAGAPATGPWATMADARRMDDIYDLFRHNVACASPKVAIHHMRAPSETALPALRDSHFDIVYVDGRHGYRHVLEDLQAAQRLVRFGGLLAGDDLEAQLHQVDADHARANSGGDMIQCPRQGCWYHVGVTLAVHEFFGEVSNYSGYYVMRRTPAGFRQVDLRDCRPVVLRHFPPAWQDALRDALARTPG